MQSLFHCQFSGIYLITCKVNGKVYVGQSQNLANRMSEHKKLRVKCLLADAFRKHGLQNFDVKVLEEVPIECLDEREQYWLDRYQSYERGIGYNICKVAGTTRGRKHTQETKTKIKNNIPGKCGADNPFYGKKHSQETKDKIGFKNSTKVRSKEHLAAMEKGRLEKTLKPVAQIDTATGVVVKIWPSMTSACDFIGVSYSVMSSCCSGKRKDRAIKGFLWERIVL